MGDRDDLKYSPNIWLFWREVNAETKAGSGEFHTVFKTLAPPDVTNAVSVTTTSSENSEPRMALILVGYGDLNPQIFGRGRRKVIGFLDTISFARILNSIQRSVNIPNVLLEIETQHATRSLNSNNK